MPKAFTSHEKELIRKRLLEQGNQLFSAHGLKKTNVEEIAQAAGISKGAFYLFYESKEMLFMEVVEQAEIRLRQEIVAMIDLPGPSPRARLFAVLKRAFSLFESLSILQFFTGRDYDLLLRRIPEEKLRNHLANDRTFFLELIGRCQNAGIPIRAQPEQITGALYPIVLAILHKDDLDQNLFRADIDLLLELVAAFCLGEVEPQVQRPVRLTNSY